MNSPPPVTEVLAAALAGAREPVVLTGLRLGANDADTITTLRGEWSDRANLEAFLTEPARFWEYFYPTVQHVLARRPNAAHLAIARLQGAGLIGHLITQSADHLHARTGADAIEVYGNLTTVRCERCGERYGLPEVAPLLARAADGVPRCTTDGCAYPLRPGGTLWNEPLPAAAVTRAWECAAAGDAFFAFDCDLRTTPISLLPSVPLTRQVPLYIIGETPTQYDRYAALVVRRPSIEILPAIADLLVADDG